MPSREDPFERLVVRLKCVRPDSPRRWGRMTAHQMLCHLGDAFRMALGEREVSHDANLFNRTILKWGALHVPLRWPPGILTRPEIDQVMGAGTNPTDFALDLDETRKQLESFRRSGARLDGRSHPLFGPLSLDEWLRWGYLHVDHHLRQFGA